MDKEQRAPVVWVRFFKLQGRWCYAVFDADGTVDTGGHSYADVPPIYPLAAELGEVRYGN